MNLTYKMEGFVKDLFNGAIQHKAYENYYNTKGMLPATIDRAAHELAQNPKITARLAELNAQVTNELVADRQEVLRFHTGLIRAPSSDVYAGTVINRENTQVKAAGELAKLQGFYAPEKHAIIGDILIEVIYVDRDKNKGTSRTASPTLPPG